MSSMAKSVYSTSLNSDTQMFAYTQGRAAREAAAKTAWGNYPTQIKEGQAGVVKAYVSSNISADQKTKIGLLDVVGKKLGLQIVVSDTLGKANGMYAGGRTIYVGLDAIDGGITKAVSHEAMHYLRQVICTPSLLQGLPRPRLTRSRRSIRRR